MDSDFGPHKIQYHPDGMYWAALPYSHRAASDVLKGAGWSFHWGAGDSRCYKYCKACKAGLPPFTRFTLDPSKAAAFRDYFSREAELAFRDQAVEVKAMAEKRSKLEAASRAADVADVDIPAPPGLSYRGYQRAGIAWIAARESTLLADEQGLGKAQPVDSNILTPGGWKRLGDIAAGDLVIGSSGKPTRVRAIYFRGRLPCARVTFNDGCSLVVARDHLWAYKTNNDNQRGSAWRVGETRELVDKIKDKAGRRLVRIPLVAPVEFDARGSRPIDPYLLAVLLGDGHLAHHPATYTPGDVLVPEQVQLVLPPGCEQRPVEQAGRAVSYRIVTSPQTASNPVLDAMRSMGLSGISPDERFVPEAYLFSGPADRLSVLQGLIDTDSECRQDTMLVFGSASRRLVEDAAFLCQSLGGVARMHSPKQGRYKRPDGTVVECRLSYSVSLSMPEGVVPVRARVASFVPKSKYLPARMMDSIEPCGDHEVACISVEAADGLYVTEECIVTHNTIQVIGAINMIPDIKDVLLIAPPHLVLNWVREANKWSVRPINAVALTTSDDIPPPAEPGTVNLLATNYEKLIQQKGIDLNKELRRRAKMQKDASGLARALAKVADRPKELRRILVLSDAQNDVDWSAAVKPKLEEQIGEVKILVAHDAGGIDEAQAWVAANPEQVSATIVHVKPQAGSSPWSEIYSKLLTFRLRNLTGQPRTSSLKGLESTAYDVLVKERVVLLRTTGRAKNLQEVLMARGFDMLVLDEMHALANPKSAQTIAVYGQQDKKGKTVKQGLVSRARKKVFLTGTPLRNVVCEMWGMLHALAPRTFNKFFPFAIRFCGAVKGRWGWDFSGESQTPEQRAASHKALQDMLRTGTEHGGLMIRRLKKDVATDLPPKTRNVLPLEPGPEALELLELESQQLQGVQERIDALETDALIAQLEGNTLAYEDAIARLQKSRSIAFDEIAQMRAELGRLKVEPSVAYIRGLLEEGTAKVIVFAHHRAVIDGLTEGLRKYGCAIIDGRVAGKGRIVRAEGDPKVIDRIEVVDAFQTDPSIRVFIGNYKAAGTGITLTAASTVVQVESTWTAADNAQAEDRAHRIGATEHVYVVYLVFDGSMDQRMLEAVVRKMDTADQVLDVASTPAEIDIEKIAPVMLPGPSAEKRPRKAGWPTYSPEVRQAAHAAIIGIATVCDGAVSRDCQGFSGTWVGAGHWLANQPAFDDRMTSIALRIIAYHHRQVPDDLLEILRVERKQKAAKAEPTKKAPKPRAPSPKAPTPKAPTPRAPTPRAPTPRAPTPRAPSPKAASEKGPRLSIFDPNALQILGTIEGPQWTEIQRRDEGRMKIDNGFHLSRRAAELYREMGDLASGTLEDIDPAAGLIAGAGGAGYIVFPDGEIVQIGDTATARKTRLAKIVMRVL